MGHRKQATRSTHGHLIKTTRNVATVLSKGFNIRSGYEVVNPGLRNRSLSFKPSILGDIEAANALKIFQQQGGQEPGRQLRRIQVSRTLKGNIKAGDVVEVSTAVLSSKATVLVISRVDSVLEGAVLVTGAKTILHDVAASNELFLTKDTITMFSNAVTAKVEPSSVVLRHAWDETRPAFIGLHE